MTQQTVKMLIRSNQKLIVFYRESSYSGNKACKPWGRGTVTLPLHLIVRYMQTNVPNLVQTWKTNCKFQHKGSFFWSGMCPEGAFQCFFNQVQHFVCLVMALCQLEYDCMWLKILVGLCGSQFHRKYSTDRQKHGFHKHISKIVLGVVS